MSEERIKIIKALEDYVDDETRRRFAHYVLLHERLVALTGNEQVDEGVSVYWANLQPRYRQEA